MVVDEAKAKEADGKARSITWYETIQSSIKDIKKLYPDIRLSCKMRYDTEGEEGESMEGGDVDGKRKADTDNI